MAALGEEMRERLHLAQLMCTSTFAAVISTPFFRAFCRRSVTHHPIETDRRFCTGAWVNTPSSSLVATVIKCFLPNTLPFRNSIG